MENNLKKCETCGKEVEAHQLTRDGECRDCYADDKSSEMCVGDLNS
ncbi:MAG: hypothetical protein ABH824_05690 [Nanoarchaeota archaeon]